MDRKYAAKWEPFLLVEIYRLSRLGMTVEEVCKTLKVSRQAFYKWKAEKPEIERVLELAAKEKNGGTSFADWVYGRLSPHLRELWGKMRRLEKQQNNLVKLEMLLQDAGKQARQELFVYALCESCFSMSAALRAVNISKRELNDWLNNEPSFAELVQEIDWHKGNFFESSLVRLIEAGDVPATLFANKTYNRSRGYASKVDVAVEHSGSVLHGVLDLTELLPYLSQAAAEEMLGALRKRERERTLEQRPLSPTEQVAGEIAASVS
jgi:hypothetical protein